MLDFLTYIYMYGIFVFCVFGRAATCTELFVVVDRILFELKQFLINLEQKMFEQI